MSFEFKVGDKVVSEDTDYYLTCRTGDGDFIVTWIEDNGVPASILYKESSLTTDRSWVKQVVRDGETVWPAPEFKFGQRVRNKFSSGSHGIFIKYNDDGKTAMIAYPDIREGVEANHLRDLVLA